MAFVSVPRAARGSLRRCGVGKGLVGLSRRRLALDLRMLRRFLAIFFAAAR
jgi:hypothetical protein